MLKFEYPQELVEAYRHNQNLKLNRKITLGIRKWSLKAILGVQEKQKGTIARKNTDSALGSKLQEKQQMV